MKNITVAGSINMDLVMKTPRLPKLGETINGDGFKTVHGGKGANQAIAASRLGADVTMIGAVGDDVFGNDLKENLKNNGINTSNIKSVAGSSGIAVITVCDGDNHIILEAGANNTITSEDIVRCEAVIKKSDALLLQFEIPMEVNYKAAEIAYKSGVFVVVNPAPMCEFEDRLLNNCNVFLPNMHEAELLCERLGAPKKGKEALLFIKNTYGIDTVIITLGSEGCIYNVGNDIFECPAFKVSAVDTTAAGDTFTGAFCVFLNDDKSNIHEAVKMASAASAITVSRFGASISIPTKKEVENFLNAN